ncbi:hypothetical protein MKX40_26755 [Paenibacillus sp. FSL R5-0517]|uniref:hypothetical protein n=1 Tax=unclassified Paenibacillus TaxID=185978 RepID=UPI0030DAF823
MRMKILNCLLIASMISSMLALSSFANFKSLPAPQWTSTIPDRGWSTGQYTSPTITTDAEGNQHIIGLKEKGNQGFLENMDGKTGEIKWSIPLNGTYNVSNDGYLFMFENNQITVMNLATGYTIWTRELPPEFKDYNYYGEKYPSKNGTLYATIASRDGKSSTIYHYNSEGRKTKKYTLPYSEIQIDGDYLFAKTYSDDPNTYVINLDTGKKIRTFPNGKNFVPVSVMGDGTLLYQNIVKNTLHVKAYSPKGTLKWNKKFSYEHSKTDLVIIQSNFLLFDRKKNKLTLYNSKGALLASKPFDYKYDYIRDFIEVFKIASDQKSFMYTVKKGNNYEHQLIDSSNLKIISRIPFNMNDRDHMGDRYSFILNNRTQIYLLDNIEKNISKYNLK